MWISRLAVSEDQMLRSNHYDVAFEAWLRKHRFPYVAVDEGRRALLAEQSLKSPDFLVQTSSGHRIVIDVKGRKQYSGLQRRRWENWATQDDLQSLNAWEEVFGSGFRGLLVFAYDLAEVGPISEQPEMLRFRDRSYAFYGVWTSDYRLAMRERSARWETVWVPSALYRQLRFPLTQLVTEESPATCAF